MCYALPEVYRLPVCTYEAIAINAPYKWRSSSYKATLIPQNKRQDTIATMIPCLCFLRMALTYIVPVRYCMNRGSANGAPAGRAFLVDIPTEAVAKVRGLDELRLLIFPQPLDRALKNGKLPLIGRAPSARPDVFHAVGRALPARAEANYARNARDKGCRAPGTGCCRVFPCA